MIVLQLCIILFLGAIFTYICADMDADLAKRRIYIYRSEKAGRSLVRVVVVLAVSLVLYVNCDCRPYWLTVLLMWNLFALSFNIIKNKMLKKHWLYLGTQSFWDSIEKRNPLLWVCIKSSTLLTLIIIKLCQPFISS